MVTRSRTSVNRTLRARGTPRKEAVRPFLGQLSRVGEDNGDVRVPNLEAGERLGEPPGLHVRLAEQRRVSSFHHNCRRRQSCLASSLSLRIRLMGAPIPGRGVSREGNETDGFGCSDPKQPPWAALKPTQVSEQEGTE